MLDIFNNDAFSVASLTEAINIVPYVPKRIGNMGLYSIKPQRTTTAFLERKGQIVSLLPTKPRGAGETTKRPAARRDLIPINIPYVPYDDALLAADISGIREYGTNDQLEMASGEVEARLTIMRQDHEVTHEKFRLDGIKGVIIDNDAAQTEICDMFDAFGLTQEEFYFDLEGSGEGIKATCMEIIQYTEEVLGGQTYDHIHSFVGNDFFQQLVSNDEVKEAYMWQVDPRWKIEQQGSGTMGRGTNQVTFGDITFENYRGKVGDVPFIGLTDAHMFPMGVPDLFQAHFAPAQTLTDVNTPGQQIYARQKVRDDDEGTDIHTESNPLMLCKRPALLTLGHAEATSE